MSGHQAGGRVNKALGVPRMTDRRILNGFFGCCDPARHGAICHDERGLWYEKGRKEKFKAAIKSDPRRSCAQPVRRHG
jgi:hypothetical protein